jgi:hypothetical protein
MKERTMDRSIRGPGSNAMLVDRRLGACRWVVAVSTEAGAA